MSQGDPRQEPAQLIPDVPQPDVPHPARAVEPAVGNTSQPAQSETDLTQGQSRLPDPAHPNKSHDPAHAAADPAHEDDPPPLHDLYLSDRLNPAPTPEPSRIVETPPEDAPQPPEQTGVDTDMASAAWQATAGTLRPDRLTPTVGVLTAHPSTKGNEVPGAGAANPTDAAIMLRVREGDDAAFNYLIEKYQRQIVHFMFRMVHNQAVAEELTQEVFLRVYRSRESYRAEAKFTTWLYRIATNLGVNHARDHKHERAALNVYLDQPDSETGTTPDVADSRATVEQELVRDERMRAIRAHVMALPERQRQAVLMHKYQEMDYKQIGDVLKLSESATKSLLFRAYQTLREKLKDYV